MSDLAEFGTCTRPQRNIPAGASDTVSPTSPLTMVSVGNDGSIANAFPPGLYFGVLNLEKDPIVIQEHYNPDNDGVVLQ